MRHSMSDKPTSILTVNRKACRPAVFVCHECLPNAYWLTCKNL